MCRKVVGMICKGVGTRGREGVGGIIRKEKKKDILFVNPERFTFCSDKEFTWALVRQLGRSPLDSECSSYGHGLEARGEGARGKGKGKGGGQLGSDGHATPIFFIMVDPQQGFTF